jgi:tetratricopeptide (TPR) repeat protein
MESYNSIMSRWVFPLLWCGLAALGAQAQQPPKETPKPAPPVVEQEPPEEDESLQPKVYAFNPLQATKEVQVGNEYFKKHSYKAAAMRYREATRWNPNFAEAWLRLGEAEERRKNIKDAKVAYAKYLELQPGAKDAAEVRKRLARL